MASPLKFIIGGDATPFAAAMKQVAAIAQQSGEVTAASLRVAEKELVKALESTELTVRQTNFYERALARVRNELTAIASAEKAHEAAINSKAEAMAMAAVRQGAGPGELSRYLATPSQTAYGGNLRAMNAADDMAWQKKFAAAKAAKGIATVAGAEAGGSFMVGFFKKLQGHNTGWAQLVHVVRATFDSLVSGISPWRVLMQQGPQAAQAVALMGSNFLRLAAMIAAPAAAIGGLIAAVYIFRSRVNSLVQDMVGIISQTSRIEHIATYLQKAATLLNLQKDVTEEVRRTREAHESVTESLERQLNLVKDRISAEKELLEAQRANELAAAKTPAEREAIEKKYSKLIMAKRKEERDAELAAMVDEAHRLPGEMNKIAGEIDRLVKAPSYMSEASEQQRLAKLKEDADAYKEYNRQLMPGEKDKRPFSAAADEATVRRLTGLIGKTRPGDFGETFEGLTSEEEQQLANARKRMADAKAAQDRLNAFTDAAAERQRARDRVKELGDKVKADAKRYAELGNPMLAALPFGLGGFASGGKIRETMWHNLQRDAAELRIEQERLKRTDRARGGGLSLPVSELERAGGTWGHNPQVAALNVNKDILKEIRGLHATMKGFAARRARPVLGGNFGDGYV